jgi:hypothetical protein
MFTTFDRCGGDDAALTSLACATFDQSCNLGDLFQALRRISSGREAEKEQIEKDLRKFFHCFIRNERFIDVKKEHIKFSPRLPRLSWEDFDRLWRHGYVELATQKRGDAFWTLTDSFKPSVSRFLANNYVDSRLRAFIDFVC